MNSSYLTDSVDLGVLSIQGGPCITPHRCNYTDGLGVERDNFIAALSFPEKHVECASMKIKNFVAVRAGVVGKVAKAFNNPRSSAIEAMLVLRLAKDALQVLIFGEINYADCNKHGENLRLMAKGKVGSGPKTQVSSPRSHTCFLFFSFLSYESLIPLSTPSFKL